MNTDWLNFLESQSGVVQSGAVVFPNVANDSGKSLYPLVHLTVLTFTGEDAAKLLQGQITCNVHDVTATKSSLGAMCNAKGRAITTFVLAKQDATFLMILPSELADIVQKKLQMYVLRSKVKITNSTDEYCLLGLADTGTAKSANFSTEHNDDAIAITWLAANNRQLLLTKAEQAQQLWLELTEKQGYQPSSTDDWRFMDIKSGLPWLTTTTTEEFIPQMLNLDKLGGISFNKGCYTGQEVVARTHYLGKVKREMMLAESELAELPAPNSSIVSGDQVVGHVLQAQLNKDSCVLQVILPVNDVDQNNLTLADYNHAAIHLLPFQA